MSERNNQPHERQEPTAPRVSYNGLTGAVMRFAGHYPNMRRDGEPLPSGAHALQVSLEEMRRDHPSVVDRGARMSYQLLQGLSDSEDVKQSPDVMNFQNCLLVGYGLMQESYYMLHREMPPDTEQILWFEDSRRETVDDIFYGINMVQLQICEEYPDLVAGIRHFVDLTSSNYNTAFSDGLTALAAYEIYNSFEQMELARSED